MMVTKVDYKVLFAEIEKDPRVKLKYLADIFGVSKQYVHQVIKDDPRLIKIWKGSKKTPKEVDDLLKKMGKLSNDKLWSTKSLSDKYGINRGLAKSCALRVGLNLVHGHLIGEKSRVEQVKDYMSKGCDSVSELADKVGVSVRTINMYKCKYDLE